MGTIALVVVVGEEERVGAVFGPHVAKLRSIPECLIGNLWHAHWVGRRTCAGNRECLLGCVVHVILVVGRVDVLAVPATDAYVSTLSDESATRQRLTTGSDAQS